MHCLSKVSSSRYFVADRLALYGSNTRCRTSILKLENKRYDFFWISIEEAIEDSSFDQENTGSTNKILGLLDPEKVGAKKILRLPEKQIHSTEDEDH
jgi:hypothetical protein